MTNFLMDYLKTRAPEAIDSGAAAFYASLDQIKQQAPSIARSIIAELRDQRQYLKLIASENYCSLATQQAMGNLFTDKYSEGYPKHRFYAGCDNVDDVELEAGNLAKELFGAEHAYVQPHSGADANLVAFMAMLSARGQQPVLDALEAKSPMALSREDWLKAREAMQNKRLMALDLYSGGHLTHGYRLNISGLLFDAFSYSVDPESHLLDLAAIRKQVREVKPFVLIAGYSAYSRKIDFAEMRSIADEVGAVFMVDMAHFSGLVAGKAFTGNHNPVPHAHIVTSTTHKTLRGPRGGIVLCTGEFADYVDKGCPAILGGPLPHVMAAKAVAFREALTDDFRAYTARVIANANAIAERLMHHNVPVITGGTDNHLLLIDVARGFGLNGRQAASALRECGVTLNSNSIPFDPNGAWYTSGLRLGAPALTTLGMDTDAMREVADIIHLTLANTEAATKKSGAKSMTKYRLADRAREEASGRARDLLQRHPLYPQLDLAMLRDWAEGSI